MSKFYMLCATAGLIIVLIGVMSLILRAANWASKEGDKEMRRLDENLALLVGEVVKTMFWENEE